jgi:hypothetical protein
VPYFCRWLNPIQDCAPRTTGWTGFLRWRYVRGMGRARLVYDPLEATAERRWYVVKNMHGALLEVRELAPGTDLKREFILTMLRCIDAGWSIAEFSSRTGVFFAQKGIERRQFEITPADYGRDRGVGSGTK